PDAVSKRMVRRMALFSGIPTSFGILSFFVSYWIVSHNLFKLPTSAVLLVSMGFFGLGVLGLSYGLFSSSWDENRQGSWLGLAEVGPNFRRTTSAWRDGRK
ncbi:MAG: PAM68 family protein, partial [Spirulinaceae cyanobacterium]